MKTIEIPMGIYIVWTIFAVLGGAVVIVLFVLWIAEGRIIPHFLTRLGRMERRNEILKIHLGRMAKMQEARDEHHALMSRLSEKAMDKPQNFET